MISFFRWIFGYVSFTFKGGFFENFITDCFNEGIEIRNIAKCEDYFVGSCNLKNYKKLHKIARKHGGVVKVSHKYGLPFILLPLKNRWGFAVGMVAFVFLLSFLSTFIWNVEVVGNSKVSNIQLETFLENNNVKKGSMWSSVDRDKICWELLSEFDDLSYAHINRVGTTAVLEVNETTDAPVGDESELRGENVFRKELEAVAYRQQKNLTVKSRNEYKTLHFFFIDMPLYINKKAGDITEESESWVTLFDKTLPIGITKQEELFIKSTPKMLDNDSLENLARNKLSYLEKKEFDGFEIINKSESVDMDDDKCIIKCSYVIRRK